MPDVVGANPNKPGSLTYVEDWGKAANDWVPMPEAKVANIKSLNLPSPRCPDIPGGQTVEDCVKVLDNVARRPYSTGLWPAWDLKKDERVLVRVSNWHHPIVIEAVRRVLEKHQTKFKLEIQDKGPIPKWQGHDEVEYYLARTKELAQWIDDWEEMDRQRLWDKVIMGYGGPILAERNIKIQRFPFIVPETTCSPAHLLAAEVLQAIDQWTWAKVRQAHKVHITDPEGTDIRFTNHDSYWSPDRKVFRRDHIERGWPSNIPYGETYLPGHIWGRPPIFVPEEDGEGVICGTMNHIAPYPRMELVIKKSVITEINGGGVFGEKLRRVRDATKHVQYKGFNEPGIMQWWEASIGTSPKIHRARENFAQGFNCGLYERMRSGVIHIGFGTILSAHQERQDSLDGKLVGHWHVHLNFPTYVAEGGPDGDVKVIENGRLCALDAPEVRAVAAKYGDPDYLLREDWIPAIPGLNIEGDYNKHYARDPMDYTMLELDICRKYHPLFKRMVSRPGKEEVDSCCGGDHEHTHGSKANGVNGVNGANGV